MNDRKHVSDFDGARVAREIARGHVTVLEGGGGGREGGGGGERRHRADAALQLFARGRHPRVLGSADHAVGPLGAVTTSATHGVHWSAL